MPTPPLCQREKIGDTYTDGLTNRGLSHLLPVCQAKHRLSDAALSIFSSLARYSWNAYPAMGVSEMKGEPRIKQIKEQCVMCRGRLTNSHRAPCATNLWGFWVRKRKVLLAKIKGHHTRCFWRMREGRGPYTQSATSTPDGPYVPSVKFLGLGIQNLAQTAINLPDLNQSLKTKVESAKTPPKEESGGYLTTDWC